MMNKREMKKRRSEALRYLQCAIDQLGPITDDTGWLIREPILAIIDQIYEAGESLQRVSLDAYNKKGEPIVSPVFQFPKGPGASCAPGV